MRVLQWAVLLDMFNEPLKAVAKLVSDAGLSNTERLGAAKLVSEATFSPYASTVM